MNKKTWFSKLTKKYPKTVLVFMRFIVVLFYIVFAPIDAVCTILREFKNFLLRSWRGVKMSFSGFKAEWDNMKNFVEYTEDTHE